MYAESLIQPSIVYRLSVLTNTHTLSSITHIIIVQGIHGMMVPSKLFWGFIFYIFRPPVFNVCTNSIKYSDHPDPSISLDADERLLFVLLLSYILSYMESGGNSSRIVTYISCIYGGTINSNEWIMLYLFCSEGRRLEGSARTREIPRSRAARAKGGLPSVGPSALPSSGPCGLFFYCRPQPQLYEQWTKVVFTEKGSFK